MDASAYITLLYAVSSFFSVLHYSNGTLDLYKESCTFLPTVIYCFLITLAIIPVYKFDTSRLRSITLPNIWIIKGLVYIYLFALIVLLIAFMHDLRFILTYGDLAELRSEVYQDMFRVSHYYGVFGYVVSICNMLASMSYVMIPIFLLAILAKLDMKIVLMAALGSLSVLIQGILNIDRSKVFYWMVILGLGLSALWPHFKAKQKKIVSILCVAMLCGTLSYFLLVSQHRFEDRDGSVEGSLVSYAGQSYINFCYFFENFYNKELFSTKLLFPVTHAFVLKDYKGMVHLQQEMTSSTGIECGVFYSFLGNFIVDNNQKGPFIYILCYLLLFAVCLLHKNKQTTTMLNFLYFFFLSIVPACGVISYIYASPVNPLAVFVIMLFVGMMYVVKIK